MNDAKLLFEAAKICDCPMYDVVLNAIRALDKDLRDAVNAYGVYQLIEKTGVLPRYIRHFCVDIVCEANNLVPES